MEIDWEDIFGYSHNRGYENLSEEYFVCSGVTAPETLSLEINDEELQFLILDVVLNALPINTISKVIGAPVQAIEASLKVSDWGLVPLELYYSLLKHIDPLIEELNALSGLKEAIKTIKNSKGIEIFIELDWGAGDFPIGEMVDFDYQKNSCPDCDYHSYGVESYNLGNLSRFLEIMGQYLHFLKGSRLGISSEEEKYYESLKNIAEIINLNAVKSLESLEQFYVRQQYYYEPISCRDYEEFKNSQPIPEVLHIDTFWNHVKGWEKDISSLTLGDYYALLQITHHKSAPKDISVTVDKLEQIISEAGTLVSGVDLLVLVLEKGGRNVR